jgi:hypothetical protein
MTFAIVFNIGLFLFLLLSFAVLVTAARATSAQPILTKNLPIFITFSIGMVMVVNFLMPRQSWLYLSVEELVSTWLTIIMSMAITLGVANLLVININKIRKQYVGWGYNVVLLSGFAFVSWIGLVKGMNSPEFSYLYQYIYEPMNQTMFSILAFYVASAAFRAFRAKNSEATMLLIAAIIVMLGRVPVGSVIWEWIVSPINWVSPDTFHWIISYMDISDIAQWINKVFTTTGQRAILLGASLGYISFSLKIVLGLERSYFGGE